MSRKRQFYYRGLLLSLLLLEIVVHWTGGKPGTLSSGRGVSKTRAKMMPVLLTSDDVSYRCNQRRTATDLVPVQRHRFAIDRPHRITFNDSAIVMAG